MRGSFELTASYETTLELREASSADRTLLRTVFLLA